VEPATFRRLPPAEMLQHDFLQKLAGEYDGAGVPVKIVLRDDNVLLYTVLGTVRELLPLHGTYFRIKDLSGNSVEFLSDPAGKIDRMALYSVGSEDTIVPRKK